MSRERNVASSRRGTHKSSKRNFGKLPVASLSNCSERVASPTRWTRFCSSYLPWGIWKEKQKLQFFLSKDDITDNYIRIKRKELYSNLIVLRISFYSEFSSFQRGFVSYFRKRKKKKNTRKMKKEKRKKIPYAVFLRNWEDRWKIEKERNEVKKKRKQRPSTLLRSYSGTVYLYLLSFRRCLKLLRT